MGNGFVTVGGVHRKGTEAFITVGGVYRKCKKGFRTVNGVYEQVWSSGIPWNKYACTRTQTGYEIDAELNPGTQSFFPTPCNTYTVDTGYEFSKSKGYYSTGTKTVAAADLLNQLWVGSNGRYVLKCTSLSPTEYNADGSIAKYICRRNYVANASYTYSYSKGSLIGTVEADEGAYPEDFDYVTGAVDGDYIILQDGNNFYYYTKA